CSSNQLNMLNAKNGNNYNFATSSDFLAYNNPNLFCIEVDDPIWSEANWPNVDSNASYSSNCLYGITYPKTITGKVVADDNCVMNGSEQGINNIIVKTDDNNYYGLTEISGSYTIITDTGTYIIVQVLNNPLITPLCPIPNYYTIYFDTLGMDTTNIDFYNEAIACQYLTIDINSDRRRRCFTNNTLIHYCNDGFADAVNTQVHVHFPDFMSIVSADYPYTTDSLGNYVFDIGTLAQGDCGDIHIIDSVACIPGITGLTQCTEVWITPPNDCANSLDTASYNAWDHSSVMVEGECISDSIVRFIITNTGDVGGGDMQIPSEYRIYADNLLVYTGTFQLNGQEELVIDIPADGRTYRLEADQHPNHHGNSHPNETIEACGDGSTPISNGFVNSMPMDDTDPEIEIDCMMILDSYDPNDKSVSPQGITDNNYLLQGTMLDYVIRFQNTGSDTAYTVVVVDTLSSNLDISTFQQGISSHPYTFDVRGQGSPVLFFQFFNINLPDSTTDEENSHGFVKFKIAPYDSLSNGTIIENTAYIYFDYNIPVITNIALVTISDTAIIGNPISIIGIEDNSGYQNMDFKAIPNPFSDQIEFIFKNTSTYEIRIFNILGKEAYSAKVTGNNCSVSTSELPGGTYLIKVKSEERVGIKKMVKH
ncbi:MAG: T9SS type A sorting domain-containing protein, partial [Bacteroidota bacterium]